MNFSGGKWKEKSVVTALWDKQIKVFLNLLQLKNWEFSNKLKSSENYAPLTLLVKQLIKGLRNINLALFPTLLIPVLGKI